MCGIIGYVAPKAQFKDRTQRLAVLTQGLYVDTLRGNGGTGIACVDRTHAVSVFKRGLAGPDFLSSQMFDLARRALDDSVVAIGHNRAATIGNVSDKNAHPFHYKDKQDIVLVHNGTLNSYTPLTPTGFDHSVDSAHIAFAMASEDDEMAVLRKLKGAFVLVWYNATKKTFNIARNDSRDIWYNQSTDGTLYFASEYLMLDWLLNRADVNMGKREYRSPNADTWYQWQIDEHLEIKKPVVRKIVYVKEEPRPVYPQLWSQDDAHAGRRYGSYSGGTFRSEEDILSKFGLKRRDLVFIDVDYWEPYNKSSTEFGRMEGEVVATFNDGDALDKALGIDCAINGVSKRHWERIQDDKMRFYLPVRVLGYIKYTSSDVEKSIMISAEIDWTEYEDLVKRTEPEEKKKKVKLPSRGLDQLAPPKEPQQLLVAGPHGAWITEDHWKALTDKGCVWCSDPIVPQDFEKIKWVTPQGALGDAAPLCQNCSENTSVVSEVDAILEERKVSQK